MLEATEAILAEAGVARLSTKEIARRASVAESSIFYHFRDRLGLLQAVVRGHLPGYGEAVAELHERAGRGSLRDNLIALLGSLEAFYLRIAPIIAAVQSDGELRARFADRSAADDIGPRRALIPVVEYLARERDLGRLAEGLDLESTAQILAGVAYHRAMLRSLAGTEDIRLTGVAQVVDVLLPSLGRR
ncbi:TetR/AcrR family transcriptional regulator [Micromonospora sp. NPDC004551]|uniref:TetR/AcrR family transcriptional regulator n=1 Tax=Micromonospora sp. NPDC004551 TaxID=3154284 RepID=UPI0033A035FB